MVPVTKTPDSLCADVFDLGSVSAAPARRLRALITIIKGGDGGGGVGGVGGGGDGDGKGGGFTIKTESPFINQRKKRRTKEEKKPTLPNTLDPCAYCLRGAEGKGRRGGGRWVRGEGH